MSNIDTVRTLISDFPQYVSASSIGDGFTTEFALPYAPIIAGSLKLYFNAVKITTGYSEDDTLGVVTTDQPPALNVAIAFSAQATLLSDTQINSLFALYPDSDTPDLCKLTAADCLDIIASSEALIQKKVKMLDMEIDGPALAKALRDHANSLRAQVKDANESAFDFAEQVNDRPGFREKIIKDLMRSFG